MSSGKDAAIARRRSAPTSSKAASPFGGPAPAFQPAHPYAQWIAEHEPTFEDLHRQAAWAAGLASPLRFSIVTPLYRTPPELLRLVASSVGMQSYGHWEWLVAVADDEPRELRRLVAELAKNDRRIRAVKIARNEGIAATTNAALAQATGDYVAFLDHDDELAPFALFELARRLMAEPDLDLVYSDEDFLAPDGQVRYNLTAKPDWSPETFLGHNYLCHFVAIRRALVTDVGGLRAGFEGSQDWDFLFRVTERTNRIGHIAKCLYHWRAVPTSCASGIEAKPYALQAQRRAVQEHFGRRGIEVQVETLDTAMQRVTWQPPEWPLASIIIPTRDQPELLRTCLQGLLEETEYPRLEVVLVDNGSTDSETLSLYEELSGDERVRVVNFDRPFNYSAACNAGAAAARGEVLVFLNNDTEVLHEDWLDELVRWTLLPEIGVVGPKLLFPTGLVQHAGMALGHHSLCGHLNYNLHESTLTGYGNSNSYRNVMALTGACQAVRREVFERLGGYDEAYEIAYSDCAICVKAVSQGLRNLYTPYARLVHHESATRERATPAHDAAQFARFVSELGIRRDPYISPSLDVCHPLAPPRTYSAASNEQVLAQRLEEALYAEVVPIGADAVRHIWRSRPDLRKSFPWGLLPQPHNAYGDWLRRSAGLEFSTLAEEAIAAFDAATDRPSPANLADAYLHSVEAQEEHPLALTAFGDGAWEGSLRTEGVQLPDGVRAATVFKPLDELRLLARQTPGVGRLLTAAAADTEGRRRLMAWARGPARQRYRLSSEWLARLEKQLDSGAIDSIGVNLIGHLASHSGLGEAARGLHAALCDSGVAVAARNVPHPWGIDGLLPLDHYSLDLHDINIYALQPEGIATRLPDAGVTYREANYRIGHWTWELENVPQSWLDGFADVDEIWVPSRFVAEAVERATDLPIVRVPYCVERGPVEPFDRAELGIRPDDYVFLFMYDNSSVMERKNPLAVVQAFKQAFGLDERAVLLLKVGRSDYDACSFAHLKHMSGGHNIRLWTAPLARPRVNGLMDACDCYVSLHRAEGFGLSMAEAMLAGKPVIATAWSGNMDFMTNENSLPVAYELIDVPGGLPWYEKGNRWADASVDHAASQMRWVFEHRNAAAQVGATAREQVMAWLSRKTIGGIMRRRLETIVGSGLVARSGETASV